MRTKRSVILDTVDTATVRSSDIVHFPIDIANSPTEIIAVAPRCPVYDTLSPVLYSGRVGFHFGTC